MTEAKILEVLAKYQAVFEEAQIEKIPHPRDREIISPEAALSHCHWMIGEIKTFVDQGQIDKACHWLGFVQCFFWMQDIYTIGELADHNRPDGEETKDESDPV